MISFGRKKPETKEAAPSARPLRYYERDGIVQAYGNKMSVLAFGMTFVALAALVFAFTVKAQPPTVIRILPNGESAVLGPTTAQGKPSAAVAGTDDFLNRAFLRRFLASYQDYTPSNVSDRWAASMNMMTSQLRASSLKAMTDGDLRGKIDTDQITSVFHLRMIQPITGEPLAYQVYGVKDIHRVSGDSETSDRLVNEYRVRLTAMRRTEANPDGLRVAEYEELPIDGQRRAAILADPDQQLGE